MLISFCSLRAKALAAIILLLALSSAQAAIRSVGPIGLTVGNLDREIEFYTKTLPFQLIARWTNNVGADDDLFALNDTHVRQAELRLGAEHITLTEHLTHGGRPIPPDSQSHDHWFQHIAIVVSDMDRAYAILQQHGVKHVSTEPQTLPAWNENAGGIKAFYFRDPEDHVLEIIWFPAGKGTPKWQAPGAPLFQGIDHTAIVVSATESSLAFYCDELGMKAAGTSENYGPEQEHLNQVFGARLRITALRSASGPGIELLEYIAPPGGRPLPTTATAQDLVFWTTALGLDNFDTALARIRQSNWTVVSRRVSLTHATARQRSVIIRDPDGHAVQLLESEPVNFSAK